MEAVGTTLQSIKYNTTVSVDSGSSTVPWKPLKPVNCPGFYCRSDFNRFVFPTGFQAPESAKAESRFAARHPGCDRKGMG